MAPIRAASPTLQSLTRPELIFPRLAGTDRAAILRELARRFATGGVVRDADTLYKLLDERERLGSTGIGSGVAVPHCKVKGLGEVVLGVGLAEEAIDFESVDGLPVRLFFVVLSPPDRPAAHLQSLAAISRWVKVEEQLKALLACHDAAEILACLRVDADGD